MDVINALVESWCDIVLGLIVESVLIGIVYWLFWPRDNKWSPSTEE